MSRHIAERDAAADERDALALRLVAMEAVVDKAAFALGLKPCMTPNADGTLNRDCICSLCELRRAVYEVRALAALDAVGNQTEGDR